LAVDALTVLVAKLTLLKALAILFDAERFSAGASSE
jgi:hypothetical protein